MENTENQNNNETVYKSEMNNYVVKSVKKHSALNIAIINLGICLAISVGLLFVRVFGGEEIITTFIKSVV